MSKDYEGVKRCDRCDRPLSDPTANYGWRCAQIVGLNGYNNPTAELDEDALLMYNAYRDYLSKNDANDSISNVATVAYNDNTYMAPESDGILNTGYDESGAWHDWDAEQFGTDTPEYKMLMGLNTAYERASIWGHWSGDKERIAHLAATLRVTDTRITDVIVLNNSEGAWGNGHTALILMNPHGQGFYFSYSAANVFSNPGHYNAAFKRWGEQCDSMVQQILSVGGIGYEKKVCPNSSFELFRDGKVTWINETGVRRGVDK